MLELIDRGSCSDAHPTPLLFVHGACHAAWCWDAHFLDYFADRGFRALAAVLMSSAPPRTWFMRSMWAGRRRPWLAVKSTVTRNALALYPEPALVREGLFSPRTPEPVVQEGFERIQHESFRALTTDMGFRDLIRTRLVTTPLLVLEGEQVSWGRRVARDIARAYRTEAEFFPDMGHNMMLEPGWQAVAERIDSWLGGQPR
jgi:pimeloyl-ACP methyl ester carboxylesterase